METVHTKLQKRFMFLAQRWIREESEKKKSTYSKQHIDEKTHDCI